MINCSNFGNNVDKWMNKYWWRVCVNGMDKNYLKKKKIKVCICYNFKYYFVVLVLILSVVINEVYLF